MTVARDPAPDELGLALAGDVVQEDRARTSSAADAALTDKLVSLAQNGDREAFDLLFRRFHDEIYRFAARRIGDPTAAQDVAAETFVDAFSSLHRFRKKGAPFEAWLYTIARRRVVDHARARTRASRPAGRAPDVAPDPGPGVLDALTVRTLIARLSDAERDVIELRFMEDLDVEETALRLGKAPGAVRVAQHRALIRLRTMIDEGGA